MVRCGLFELVVDLRGEIVGAGTSLASLLRLPPEEVVGRPVTRFLRGPAMTAPYGTAAAVSFKVEGAGNVPGLALRALIGERIHITVLPGSEHAAAGQAPPARLRAIERLVDEAVRDVHNPLTGIMGFAALAQLAPTPHRRRYYLEQVATQAQRCRRLLQSLDAGIRPVTPYPAIFDLAEQGSLTVGTMRLQLEGHGISVELTLPGAPVWVEADPKLLGDALVSFVHRGTLGLRRDAGAREVVLRVEDSARVGRVSLEFAAVASSATPLLERFAFDNAAPATANALADVEFQAACDALREQGCRLASSGLSGRAGARVTLEVPRSAPPKRVDQTRTPVPLDILALDDDAMMGELYHELLGVSGHSVTACRSLRSAREALHAQRFDAVIADFFFADGTFAELWAEASAQHPELAERVVLITGDRAHAQVRDWLTRGRTPVLSKPFTTQALLAQVAALTA